MKCISCEIEINPQWTHAIDINVCPFCGKHIMEEHLKNLFGTLRETMESLSDYPDQLNDWMLSNHSYIKTDSPNIGKYMPADMLEELKKVEESKMFRDKKESQRYPIKIKTENGEEEIWAEKIQSEEKTNDFFKRAEVIKTGGSGNNGPTKQQLGPNVFQSPAEKTAHLKKIAEQIRKVGSEGLGVDGNSMMLPAEMLDNADPEALLEYQQMISGGGPMSTIDSDSDWDDELPGGDGILQANMAIAASKMGSTGANAKDVAALNRLQSKVSGARKSMMTGGGGFSRS